MKDPQETLRAAGLRLTPQRLEILRAFEGGRTEHLTADQIFDRVRLALPTVSRATVYSTLAEFSRGGLLATLGRPEPVLYESNVERHDHFRCSHCGRRFDVPAEDPAPASGQPLEAEGFEIERRTVALEGTCGPCAQFGKALTAAVASRRRARAAAALETLLDRAGDVAVGTVDGPLGLLHVAASADGLMRVVFPEHADAAVLAPLAGGSGSSASAVVRDSAVEQISEYLGGTRRGFDVPIDWDAVGRADAPVLRDTERVPYGTRLSYFELTDSAPRSVGRALGANPMPLVLPCHRVGRAADDPVDYTGGIERKLVLGEMERGFSAR